MTLEWKLSKFTSQLIPNGILFWQVHTFYEAVGYMIAASTDEQQQEQLIEKYMLLPNQVWDDIITQVNSTPRNTIE